MDKIDPQSGSTDQQEPQALQEGHQEGKQEAVRPAPLAIHDILAETHSEGTVIMMLEASFANGELGSEKNLSTTALALRKMDPSDRSLQTICLAVRRVLNCQITKFFAGAQDRAQRAKAIEIMQRLESVIPGIAAFYQTNYAEKPYADLQTPDEATRISQVKDFQKAVDAGVLNKAVVARVLPNAHGFALTKIIQYLAFNIANRLIVDQSQELMRTAMQQITEPADIFAIADGLEWSKEMREFSMWKREFLDAVRTYAGTPRNMWRSFCFCVFTGMDLSEGKNLASEAVKLLTQEIPLQRTQQFALSFINEPNRILAGAIYAKAPEKCKLAVLDSLKGNVLARDEEDFETALLAAEILLSRSAIDTAVSVQFRADVLSRHSAVLGEREREIGDRRQRAAAAALRAAARADLRRAKPAPAVSENLEPGDFQSKLRNAVAGLKVKLDIDVRARGITGLRDGLQEEFRASIQDAEFFKDFDEMVECEEDSVLRRLGISAVRFKKTNSFDVSFVFEKGPEEGVNRAYQKAHLSNDGELRIEHFPIDVPPWVKQAMQYEVLRMFDKVLGGPNAQEHLDTILALLGFKEISVEVPPAEAQAAFPEAVPQAVADEPSTPLSRTAELAQENYALYEKLLEAFQAADIPGSFKEVLGIYFELQDRMRINKAIPPGGVVVELQEGSHVLAPFVRQVNFYNPAESREIISRLGIAPELFHVAERFIAKDGSLDGHLARVHATFGTPPEEHILTAFISPQFDVYILGVDPQGILDEEQSDKSGVALNHSILQAFAMAVTRDSDPENTRTDDPDFSGGGRNWTQRFQEAIREVTRAFFPVIVVEWGQTLGTDIVSCPPSGLPGGPSGKAKPSFSEFLRKLFTSLFLDTADQMTTEPDARKLATLRRLYLKAEDYLRILSNGHRKFPADAFIKNGGGLPILKGGYEDIYIPVDSEQDAERIFQALREQRFVSKAKINDSSPEEWFEQQMKQPNAKPGAIFARGLATMFATHRGFMDRCHDLFRDQQSMVHSMEQLFDEVLRRAQAQNPAVAPADVLAAFARMSPLNPEKVFIATSGPRDYRLPFYFGSESRDMPAALMFDDADFEVDSGLPLPIVRVIAGSRARLSNLSDSWIQCKQRSSQIDFAAQIQRQYRTPDARNEIMLDPIARAMLVFEFEDPQTASKRSYAFRYLDGTRDSLSSGTLASRITAEQKLQTYGSVRRAMDRSERENRSGTHSDFSDYRTWSTPELLRLEREGILTLTRSPGGTITGIASTLKILRKKIVIFKQENVGYRQFRSEPTSLSRYQEFGHEEGGLDIGAGIAYDPKIAGIQKVFYALLQL